MKKKNARIKLNIVTAMMAFSLLSGCGQKEVEESYEESNYINVGFSQVGAESDWRVANSDNMRSTLSRENGFELMFDDAQQKQDKQIIAMRNFIQQEVDYIVLAPVTETGWDTVLQEAKDADIPVIIVDRKVSVNDTDLYNAWVGSDFTKEGKVACEWLKSYTEMQGMAAEDIHIVDIQGTLGATAQIGRSNSVKEASGKYGWDLIAQIPADYTQAKGKEVMQNLLAEYDNINVVYCENDNEAIGAIEALEEAGKKVGSDISNGEILVISFDATHSGLSLVLEGKIALDVECNPLQGEEVKNIINAIETGQDYDKYTYVKEKAFCCDDKVTDITVDGTEFEITEVTDLIINSREY